MSITDSTFARSSFPLSPPTNRDKNLKGPVRHPARTRGRVSFPGTHTFSRCLRRCMLKSKELTHYGRILSTYLSTNSYLGTYACTSIQIAHSSALTARCTT
ncbi:hypothetical protein LX32DRAFT_391298 [Colletotrichum zoysiae]|uniref:Uncharacterized protein n=1 Tax=Colletotrichum zoysiae TaxID=1216348 RepID=A0AAD9HI46_9PEZI|nr:hypothetical protein LX32DRAFT_391298 [Colletotrichum zoysiae]